MNAITLCWLEPVCTGDTALCNGRNVEAGATLCNVCTPQWPSHNCQPCVSFHVFLVTPAHLAASGLVLVDRGITGDGLHDVGRHSAAIPGSHNPWPSCRTSWRCGIMFTHSNQVVTSAKLMHWWVIKIALISCVRGLQYALSRSLSQKVSPCSHNEGVQGPDGLMTGEGSVHAYGGQLTAPTASDRL